LFSHPQLGNKGPTRKLLGIMKPIEILKRGLLKLHNQVQQRKSELEAKLKAGQPVSDADMDWLDGDGNLIDEEQVVEILDNASDYERGFDRLNPQKKVIVQRLRKLAGKGGGLGKDDIPSRKRKSKSSPFS